MVGFGLVFPITELEGQVEWLTSENSSLLDPVDPHDNSRPPPPFPPAAGVLFLRTASYAHCVPPEPEMQEGFQFTPPVCNSALRGEGTQYPGGVTRRGPGGHQDSCVWWVENSV